MTYLCEPYVDCSLCYNKLCDACVHDGSKFMVTCKECKITICRGSECCKICTLCRGCCCKDCFTVCSSGCGKLMCNGCSKTHTSDACAKRSKTGE